MVNAPEVTVTAASPSGKPVESKTTEISATVAEKKPDNGTLTENGDHVNGSEKTEDSKNASEAKVEELATVESATELLTKGKRDLFCDNPTQAVATLSEACAQFDKVFGEGNVKCAKGYFWYGNALMELARVENDVLGNALQGIPSGDTPQKGPKVTEDNARSKNEEGVVVEDPDSLTEQEKEDVREKVAEAMEEAAAEGEEKDEIEQTETAEDDKSMTAEEKDEDKTTTEDNEAKEGEEDKENASVDEETTEETTADQEKADGEDAVMDEENIEEEQNDEDDDDEDDDSLKLSWQMLDWARKLFEAATDQEIEGRTDLLAQCFLKLGENLMESSHHTDAEVEFKKCIEVYLAAIANIGKDSSNDKEKSFFERSLAEAYFMAGVNLTNGKNYTNAVNNFEAAISVIKKLMASTEMKLQELKGESEEVTKQKSAMNDELKQLQDILPNMEEKLQDAKLCSAKMTTSEAAGEGDVASDVTTEKSALQEAMRQVEEKEAAEMSESAGVASGPAKSINHLVKRKSPLKEKQPQPAVAETNNSNTGSTHMEKDEDDAATKRKADPTSDSDSIPSKKAKMDEMPNGDAQTNGVDSENKSAPVASA